MGKVISNFTMSLDGFIAGPDDDVSRLFAWYGQGDTAFPVPGSGMVFRISRASAELLKANWDALGAIVTGRHDFDVSKAWGGNAFMGLPMFVVTHSPPEAWLREDSPFTFVTDGVESAIRMARNAAGERNVAVSGSTIVRQCLQAGLLDELQIDLVPLLLGAGTRLFEGGIAEARQLEMFEVVEGTGVVHLRFRVVKARRGGGVG